MNKNKLFKLITLSIIMFFVLFQKVSADYVGMIKPPTDPYKSLSYYSTGLPSNYTRYLKAEIFYARTSNGTVRQVYCVQQNTRLGDGYSANPTDYVDFDKLSNTKKAMIFQAMSYAYNFGPASSLDDFKSKVKKADVARTLGAQELIWEIARGERTTFNTYDPKGGSCTSKTCPFYNLIKNGANGATAIWNEYTRIIDAVHYAFVTIPNGFKLPSQAQTYSMDYKNGKFILTLNDSHNAYKYFNVQTPSGISASVTNGGGTLTITSNGALSSPATITITNTNPEPVMLFYVNDNKQNLARGSASIKYALNITTPEYQIKINKKAKLDGKPLKGATFSVCSNSSCTSVLGSITTGNDGTATYNKIKHPGTYYVKETRAPDGYELDSTPHAITVTTSNVTGTASYGTATITDTNKEFNLTKKSVDENGVVIDLDDGCGTDTYTGPEFEIRDKNGNGLYFVELKPGEYNLADKETPAAVTKLKTCKGKFKVYTLTECNYTIIETKAPEGLTLPSEPTRDINVCGSGKNVSFTNGFAGLEFQKKDEDGNFVTGGKFALQRKINNVYKDVLLKQVETGTYVYDSSLKETDEGATYIMLTKDGISRISKLPPGEYRVVEKEAPDGYELIKDKDSKALVTIKDSDKDGYYLVEMIDQKVTKNGSKSFAELIITIITGRKVPNYVFIISSLVILLILAIIVRKRMKK